MADWHETPGGSNEVTLAAMRIPERPAALRAGLVAAPGAKKSSP